MIQMKGLGTAKTRLKFKASLEANGYPGFKCLSLIVLPAAVKLRKKTNISTALIEKNKIKLSI